jgi:anti-sigma factor RsiW
MADFPQHPTDLLQDAIDGRLDAAARAELDAHLASCEQCRRELDALRWTKTQAGLQGRSLDVPPDFYARVQSLLDQEDTQGTSQTIGAPRAPYHRLWVAGAAAAAVLIAFLWFSTGSVRTAPAEAADHLRAFRSNTLALEIESNDQQALEAHLRATGAPATRVYDFGMMGYMLVGVRTHALNAQPTALAAYRGTHGEVLLCEMYVGRIETLPTPAERRTHNDIEFYVYREGDVTVVFWQEGAIVCVLSGTGDPEAIVALAFAKAIKV